MTNLNPTDCLDYRGDDSCSGEVEYHSIDPGRTRAFPRCAKHWLDRLDQYENSLEKYATSDVPPSWFDPTYAGETW